MKKSRSIRGYHITSIFDDLDYQIETINDMINGLERSGAKYAKMCGLTGPKELTGISYTGDGSSNTSLPPISFGEAYDKMIKIKGQVDELKEKRDALIETRKKYVKYCKMQKSVKDKVFYYRQIEKLTQEATANEIGYSVRQVQRIEKQMRDDSVN